MFNLMSRRKDEEGVAMVIALLVIIIAAGIMATMTIGAVSNAQQVTDTRNHTYHTQAVESAVQNALAHANGSINGCPNPDVKNPGCIANYTKANTWKKGKEGDIPWQWRAEAITGEDGETHYDIYAIALGEDPSGEPLTRALKVRLDRVNIYDYAIDNRGQIRYITDPSQIFDRGAFGSSSIEFQSGSEVKATHDGSEVSAQVATNGEAVFSYLSSVNNSRVFNIDDVLLADTKNNGQPKDRCKVTENKGGGFGIGGGGETETRAEFTGQCLDNSTQEEPIDLYSAYEKVKETCLSPGAKVQEEWKSSTAEKNEKGNAILEAGCYESITVGNGTDVDVYASGKKTPTSDVPAEVNVVGDYTQGLGTSVQPYGIGNEKDSSLFYLYSTGNKFTVDNYTSNIGKTTGSFTGLVAGHDLTCSSRSYKTNNISSWSTPRDFQIHGALACEEIKIGSGVTINYDEGVSSKAKNTGVKTMWEMGDYNNSTYEEVMG